MDFFTLGIPALLLVIVPLIVFHELGHYWAARWFGVGIEAFSVGFGPELFGWHDKHGTRWRIAAIPLGGYVKMAGDMNAASAPSADIPAELWSKSLHSKPVWQRAIVVAAGPVANFILAIAIFAGIYMALGIRQVAPIVGQVVPDSPAQAIGLAPGDRILAIGEQPVTSWEDIGMAVNLSRGQEVPLAFERDGQRYEAAFQPQRDQQERELFPRYIVGILPFYPPEVRGVAAGSPAEKAGFQVGDVLTAFDDQPMVDAFELINAVRNMPESGDLQVTVARDGRALDLTLRPVVRWTDGQKEVDLGLGFAALHDVQRVGPFGALIAGTQRVGSQISVAVKSLALLFQGRLERRDMGGMVKMAAIAQDVSSSLLALLTLAASISVALGFFNLLPIPVLDGGHLALFAYEAVVGRPLPRRIQELAFALGFALIIALALYLNVGEVFDALGGWQPSP